jgi:hypothetical protein
VATRRGAIGFTVIVVAATLTGCHSTQHTAPASQAPSGSPALSSVLSTCGTVPASDGPLASKVTVAIQGRAAAASGSTFNAAIQVRSTTGTIVHVDTISVVDLLITKDGRVVGRTLGASAATGTTFDATPSSAPQLTTEVVLSGCGDYTPGESLPDTTVASPDASRAPLPAGTYTIYALVEDDSFGELNPRTLVSQPFTLQIITAANPSDPHS